MKKTMALVTRLALGLLFVAASAWPVQPVTVCFRNPHLVSPTVLNFTIHALKRYQNQFATELRFSCQAPNPVIVTFREAPPQGRPADALGATRVLNGRILPDIEIYRLSVRQMLRDPGDLAEGRALATVTAHELHHYLWQQPLHEPSGLRSELLTAQNLIRGFH